jgi:hypothetical protein
MKNIFVLTKNEQRVVIVFVMVLLAATLAKHYRDNRSPIPATTSTSSQPTAAPSPSSTEGEQALPPDAP